MGMLFSAEEHAERVSKVRARMAHDGLDALLVVGRGGGAIDRYGNVFYLTEAYAGFPTIPDAPGEWTDRGWTAVLLTADELRLIGDPDTAVAGSAYADSFTAGLDFTAMVVDAIGPVAHARVGLVGVDALTVRTLWAINAAHPGLTMVEADQLLMDVRVLKSPAEIEAMRQAAAVAGAAMAAAMEAAQPGASLADTAAAAAAEVARAGAVMANAFTSVAPEHTGLAHPHLQAPPYPADSILRAGDMYSLDVSGALRGYFFDVARTKVVGAEPTPEQAHVMGLSRDSVNAVVDALRPGVTVAQATRAGLAVLEEAGYTMAGDGGWQAMGHGLGMAFESPYLFADNDDVVQEGMVISVERHCTIGDASATFERNLVIGADGARDLLAIPASF